MFRLHLPKSILRACFRSYCNNKDFTDFAKKASIYQNIILIPDDQLTTATQAINKGFAYLSANEYLFSGKAQALFEKANSWSADNQHKKILQCGMDQITRLKDGTIPSVVCFHVVIPTEGTL